MTMAYAAYGSGRLLRFLFVRLLDKDWGKYPPRMMTKKTCSDDRLKKEPVEKGSKSWLPDICRLYLSLTLLSHTPLPFLRLSGEGSERKDLQ